MDDIVIPYCVPEQDEHSFFFIDQRIKVELEAKLHRHETWELYYVVHGYGNRMAGDTLQLFTAGDVALLPPSMSHRWIYEPESADADGCIRYLMVAFSPDLIQRCISVFPEVRNRLSGMAFPANAMTFGSRSSAIIRKAMFDMNGMDELGRLCEILRLLPFVFTTSDYSFAGKPMRIERDVRRMLHINTYVMAHYVHPIALDDIAAEVGMNRSAFCSYFKQKKG